MQVPYEPAFYKIILREAELERGKGEFSRVMEILRV